LQINVFNIYGIQSSTANKNNYNLNVKKLIKLITNCFRHLIVDSLTILKIVF